MVINQNMSAPDKTIEIYKQNAAAIPLPDVPSAGGAPPPYGAPPAGAPPPGNPPAGPPPADSSVVVPGVPSPETTSAFAGLPPPTGTPADALATSTAAVQPATFTGAASNSRWSSGSLGLVVAGMAALL
jgi:hypothetical protein